jgi:O-antigen/teichoic acid export membrane protein
MRKKNSVLNIMTGVVSQVITTLLGLISRKVFVAILGLEILGVNGLFTSIVSMLSLVELGIGAGIYYSLYKPLAENDQDQIRAIMNLYSKLYKYIALAVAIIGLTLLPFLNMFIKESIDPMYLKPVYLIFLADAVMSYLLAYRKNIIAADQKSYVLTVVGTAFSIILSVTQIAAIILTHNYILYLVIKVILGLSFNLVFYYISNKMYPYLKVKSEVKINTEIKSEIIKNAKALFVVNISAYCVFGTDNILLTTFGSVSVVGLYSNYVLIIGIINNMVGQVFTGVRASFGNFMINESMDDAHNMFNILYFLNFWIITFCSVCLVVLLNPFIGLLFGKNAIFPIAVVVIIVANFYFRGMTSAIETVRNGAGLYSPYPFFKYWALLEGVLNLIIGILLAGAFKMGMYGIFLATAISTQVTVYVLPWNVYKYVFNRSSKSYYKKNFIYLILTAVIIAIALWVSSFIEMDNGYIELILKTVVSIIIPNSIIVAVFYRTNEFQYIWNMKKSLIQKLSSKK